MNENKDEKTYVTVKIDSELEQMLDKIREDYRAPTRAHALRLAIEDRFREIKKRGQQTTFIHPIPPSQLEGEE